MTPVFCACCVAATILAWSCMSASASDDAICLSSSLSALRSRFYCNSSFVDDIIHCPAKCSVKSLACLVLSGSCLSIMAMISGVSITGSRILPPRELDAFDIDPSLILSLSRPDSWMFSSRSGWNLLGCGRFLMVFWSTGRFAPVSPGMLLLRSRYVRTSGLRPPAFLGSCLPRISVVSGSCALILWGILWYFPHFYIRSVDRLVDVRWLHLREMVQHFQGVYYPDMHVA